MSASPSVEKITYVLRLSETVSACVQITPIISVEGIKPRWSFEFYGTSTEKHVKEFQQWLHGVHQELAEKWNTSFVFGVGIKKGGNLEFWAYKAGQQPYRIAPPCDLRRINFETY